MQRGYPRSTCSSTRWAPTSPTKSASSRAARLTSVQLQGVKAGERAAVDLHEETVAQGSEVNRGEAQRVDERGHYGAGLGVVTGREDDQSPLGMPRVLPGDAAVQRVERFHDARTRQHRGVPLAAGQVT